MKNTDQQNETANNTCNGCRSCGTGCDCGRLHGYGGHPILRVLLALVILLFVFIGGIKLGELKAELGMAYYGHQDMMMGHYDGYGGMGMMQQRMVPVVMPATQSASTSAVAPTAQ